MNQTLVCNIIACCLAIWLYGISTKQILRGSNQSFTTWILWVMLDIIALISVILQKGNFWVLAMYVVGGSWIVALLLYKKQFKWGWFESMVLALVGLCLIGWAASGSYWATIFSTLATVVAGASQLKDYIKKPDRETGLIYFGWTIVNTFFVFAGKDWNVEERFYPICIIPLCLSIGCIAVRRKTLIATAT